VSLWSTNTLFIPPTFAGPRGRADEAAGKAETVNDAKATEVFDTRKCHHDSLDPNVFSEVGSQSADTSKFHVREHCGRAGKRLH
jgi:hypothetical protein